MTTNKNSSDRAIATAIALQLQQAGFIAVFAGGCVRDRFLGLIPKDFDIATNATPEQIIKVFTGDTVLSVGAQFGVIIIIRDGVQVEVATLRTDGQYADGRRPDQVAFVTDADPMVALKADASRRDLTVNAMFEDPITGVVYDFFGGQEDIKAGLLRTVGLPTERFAEDRLRMLRVARFVGKLGFTVADELHAALRAHAADLKPGLVVSWERVRDELDGMLMSKHPLACLTLLMEVGLLAEILPEMMDTNDAQRGRQDPIWHPEGLVWKHTLLVLAELTLQGASFELLLAGLLHDIAKPMTMAVEVVDGIERVHAYGHAEKGAVIADAICKRLKLSSKQVFRVSEIVRLHMQMHTFPEGTVKRSKLVRLMEREDIMDLIMMQHADSLGTGRTQEEREASSHKAWYLAKLDEVRNDPNPALRAGAVMLVDGHMIKEFGFKQGPVYRVIKEAAFEAQHGGEFADVAGARMWLEAHAQEFRDYKPEAPTAGDAAKEPVVSGKRCC